jgi:hypothetical protein
MYRVMYRVSVCMGKTTQPESREWEKRLVPGRVFVLFCCGWPPAAGPGVPRMLSDVCMRSAERTDGWLIVGLYVHRYVPYMYACARRTCVHTYTYR